MYSYSTALYMFIFTLWLIRTCKKYIFLMRNMCLAVFIYYYGVKYDFFVTFTLIGLICILP